MSTLLERKECEAMQDMIDGLKGMAYVLTEKYQGNEHLENVHHYLCRASDQNYVYLKLLRLLSND